MWVATDVMARGGVDTYVDGLVQEFERRSVPVVTIVEENSASDLRRLVEDRGGRVVPARVYHRLHTENAIRA